MNIKNILYLILHLSLALTCQGRSVITPAEAEATLNKTLAAKFGTDTLTDGEHLFSIDSASVAIINTTGGKITSARRNLFCPDLLSTIYGPSLRYLEEAALYNALGIPNPCFDNITFTIGTWLDINTKSKLEIGVPDNNEIHVTWLADSTKETSLFFPIQYQDILGDNRTEIENKLIKKLRESRAYASSITEPDETKLQTADSIIMVLPGSHYTLPEVNANLYFIKDTSDTTTHYKPVYSTSYPVESLANMLVGAVPKGCEASIELTVIKHKYGEKETLQIPLAQLQSVMGLTDGCTSFWGVEEIDGGNIKGTLFFYNQLQGYDHVLRISVPIKEIGTEKVTLKGRISLYVPTSNVQNLFEPYKTKSPDERIKIK